MGGGRPYPCCTCASGGLAGKFCGLQQVILSYSLINRLVSSPELTSVDTIVIHKAYAMIFHDRQIVRFFNNQSMHMN